MKYRGRLKSVEEFQNIVVRAQEDGSVLRLKDVAKVELGTLSYGFDSQMDGKPAVTFMIYQVAGSNATEVNERIAAELEKMKEELPTGMEFITMMSSNDFLFASIYNVVETLIVAIILVILVVYFFLQDFKSTLDPVYFNHRFVDRYIRLSDRSRIHDQHSDPVCPGACHRYGSG